MIRAYIFTALAAVMLLHSCGSDAPNNTPVSPNSGGSEAVFMAEMKRVYGFKCAICHGKDGNSVIKLAPNLTKSTKSFDERVAIIKYGSESMPPQKDILDSETIKGLAKYIESLRD